MQPYYNPLQQAENVLAVSLLSLVWLMPNHQLPWGSFHHELAMAVALGFVATVVASQTRWRMPLSSFVGVLFFLALMPWLQWFLDLIPKSGTAVVSSAYVGAMALACMVGHAARIHGHSRLFDILFGALALASALNVPVQWIQWMQWYSSDFESLLLLLITPINEHQRPSGMLLQPNQLATLQVWGLIALTWFQHRRMLSLPIFILLFAWIGIGIGLTQSRTGLLEMMIVFSLLYFALNSESRQRILIVWLVVFSILVVWSLNFKIVADWVGIQHGAEARLTAIDGARIDAWRAFSRAVLESPWIGYGLSDVGFAYVAVAHLQPELFIGQRFAHAHNVFIDLILWLGIPIALFILGALGVWISKRILTLSKESDDVFALAILVSLGIHAMLELPHQFLYFITPAAIFAGWLIPRGVARNALTLPRYSWAVAGLLTLCTAGWISADYFPYQERYTEWRFENSRVGSRPDIVVHSPYVLNQIHDELALYRLTMSPTLNKQELKWVSDTARSVNSPPAYYAAAKAYALAGETEVARIWMMRFNAIVDPAGVEQIQRIWLRDQGLFPQLASESWPGYSGRRSTFIVTSQDGALNMAPSEIFEASPYGDRTGPQPPASAIR
jgi:hypothetical protein